MKNKKISKKSIPAKKSKLAEIKEFYKTPASEEKRLAKLFKETINEPKYRSVRILLGLEKANAEIKRN